MKKERLTNKQQRDKVVNFMKLAIKFSFAFIVIYVIWTQIALAFSIELNDAVTEGVFAFFGTEIVIMCLKKMFGMFLNRKSEDEAVENCEDNYE